MAKLIKEYENGIEKRILIFREKELSYSMKPCDLGAEGDAPNFSAQLQDSFDDLPEDLFDEIDMLDCETDEDEIFDMLYTLQEYE